MDEEQIQSLQTAKVCSDQLLALINDILGNELHSLITINSLPRFEINGGKQNTIGKYTFQC